MRGGNNVSLRHRLQQHQLRQRSSLFVFHVPAHFEFPQGCSLVERRGRYPRNATRFEPLVCPFRVIKVEPTFQEPGLGLVHRPPSIFSIYSTLFVSWTRLEVVSTFLCNRATGANLRIRSDPLETFPAEGQVWTSTMTIDYGAANHLNSNSEPAGGVDERRRQKKAGVQTSAGIWKNLCFLFVTITEGSGERAALVFWWTV